MKPYLKYAIVEALVTYASSADYQLILESDVAYAFKFLLEPYVKLFDTTQEVKELQWSEREAGEIKEKGFAEFLKTLYPENEIIKVPFSGQEQNSFDLEMKSSISVQIFDVVKLDDSKKPYFYFELIGKNVNRFKGVESSRGVKTYFAFETVPGNKDWWVVEAIKAFELADGNRTIPRAKVLAISQKVDEHTFAGHPYSLH
jgi:hypothetical protein